MTRSQAGRGNVGGESIGATSDKVVRELSLMMLAAVRRPRAEDR